MHRTLNRILFCLATLVAALDVVWLALGHFNIDARNYGLLFLLMLPLVGASLYYGGPRREEAISAIFAGTAFLLAFSAACSLLSYLLVTVAGPRIDAQLASIDHALGFSWPALMGFIAFHPDMNLALSWAYTSTTAQTAILVMLLGWRNRCGDLYGFCLALAAGALIALGVWTLFPSFGAFSVFTLPPNVASRLGLVLGFDYGHALVNLLKNGPGLISPSELRGLVGFPSYHTVEALVLIWYARNLRGIRWASLLLNGIVLVSIPVQGGHHLIDMVGGAIVTAVSIGIAGATVAWSERHPSPALELFGARRAPAQSG